MNTPHVDTATLGFPTGYFTIKSVATGRLLDVFKNDTGDNSPLALLPAKELSLVESTSVRPSLPCLPTHSRSLLNDNLRPAL